MKILYLLIPIGMLFLGAAVWLFLWAIKSGQYEDLEGPAHRILMDDDDPRQPHLANKRQLQQHEGDAQAQSDKPPAQQQQRSAGAPKNAP